MLVPENDYNDPERYQYQMMIGIPDMAWPYRVNNYMRRVSYIADSWNFDNSGFVATASSEKFTDGKYDFDVIYDPEQPGWMGKDETLYFRISFNIPYRDKKGQYSVLKSLYRFCASLVLSSEQILEKNSRDGGIYRQDFLTSDDLRWRWQGRCDWVPLVTHMMYRPQDFDDKMRRVAYKEIYQDTFYQFQERFDAATLRRNVERFFEERRGSGEK